MKNALFICFLLSASYCKAQLETIQLREAQIIIDGKLDESVWDELPIHSNFYNHFPSDIGKANNQTVVKLFHDGKNLYVSAVYFDTTSRIQIGSLKRDDIRNSLALSDGFVLVIDAYNRQQNGYYFAMNMKGVQVDALIEQEDDYYRINSSWNAVWEANAASVGNEKVFEMKIPLKSLGYNIENPIFGLQFYTRDIKTNKWTTYKHIERNFRPYDLRFTVPFEVKELSNNKMSRFAITPSVTVKHQRNVIDKSDKTIFKPSLDAQYNITSSLKLDATVNPDFSQIDVDRQVTNLTRFSVNFPERRNFFLENSDLFSRLGVTGVNPFYSRRVGAISDIEYGLKLSGNVTPNTRIGVLDVQTEKDENSAEQNYGVLVLQQNLSPTLTATGFLINRQEANGLKFLGDYNRVTGINLNYKSKNNKWTGLGNFGKSISDSISGKSSFYNAGIWYSERGASWDVSIKKVERNYITDIGFVPRLYNYDAASGEVIREGFTQSNASVSLIKYPKTSQSIDSYRYVFLRNEAYWDESGALVQSSTIFNNALWFKDISSIYVNLYHDYINLKYGFDPLKNGNFIQPDAYKFMGVQFGYNSVFNKRIFYNIAARYGSYYNGNRSRIYLNFGYRLLPFAKLQASYETNKVDLKELGDKRFHLARFTGEVFFTNRLNWTTYVQYNNQFDSFNINSRIQWEYKPLSYVYLVVTDNFNQDIQQTNWGVAIKVNYRFDF